MISELFIPHMIEDIKQKQRKQHAKQQRDEINETDRQTDRQTDIQTNTIDTTKPRSKFTPLESDQGNPGLL